MNIINISKTLLLGSIFGITSVMATDSDLSSLSSTDQNLQLVQKILEYGDLQVAAHMEEFFAEIVRVHSDRFPEGEVFSLDEASKYETSRNTALLAKEWKLLNTFVSEDVIVLYFLWNGVHRGEFMGLPATNKEFNIPVTLIYRFQNGRICEVWSSWDKLSLLKQLGNVHVTPKQE